MLINDMHELLFLVLVDGFRIPNLALVLRIFLELINLIPKIFLLFLTDFATG